MAKTLGETGRYVADQATKKLLRIFLLLYFFGIVLGFCIGYVVGAKQIYVTLLFLLIFPFFWKYLAKKIDAVEKERSNFRKGASGEELVGYALDKFPDEFYVIHDLTTPYGNVDHVVIGPTGAYIIDAKNWRGVVAADGNGELQWNGMPTQKPEVKNLTRRIMNIKEKIKVLSSLDPYVQGVFAFPSAYVEAKWGSTGYVHCIKDEQLYDYIVENKKSKKLDKKTIESISQAFLALARMDKDFAQNGK